jgi:hypothetical protein
MDPTPYITTIIEQVPNLAAFLVLVWIFTRHIERREKESERVIENNTEALHETHRVMSHSADVTERAVKILEKLEV